MPPVNLSKGTNGCNKKFGVNDNVEIEKILSPEKNRERVRSKTVYIVKDWGRILPQQSGEWELARDIVEPLAGNLMTKKLASGSRPTKRCIYKYVELY